MLAVSLAWRVARFLQRKGAISKVWGRSSQPPLAIGDPEANAPFTQPLRKGVWGRNVANRFALCHFVYKSYAES